MPWLRRWRRKQNNTVNAPTFRELFEQQQQQGLRTEQSLSTGDPASCAPSVNATRWKMPSSAVTPTDAISTLSATTQMGSFHI